MKLKESSKKAKERQKAIRAMVEQGLLGKDMRLTKEGKKAAQEFFEELQKAMQKNKK